MQGTGYFILFLFILVVGWWWPSMALCQNAWLGACLRRSYRGVCTWVGACLGWGYFGRVCTVHVLLCIPGWLLARVRRGLVVVDLGVAIGWWDGNVRDRVQVA